MSNYGRYNRNYRNSYYDRYDNRQYNSRYHNQQPKPRQHKVVPDYVTDESYDLKNKLVKATDMRGQTEDVTKTKGSEFENFQLSRVILAGIFELGFERPSPIQEQAIPLILMGRSTLARAKNGTGKTGAFAIPTLEKVQEDLEYTQLLVLLPTRELALQTAKVYKDLAVHKNVEIVTSTGGTDLKEDIIRLQAVVHIVIGTPGRLQDLAEQNSGLQLGRCNMIVLDEADKLLSPDFIGAVEVLLGFTPEVNRQLLLFSATFPSSIKQFKDDWLPECDVLNLMDELTLKGISQYYAYVDENEKVHCLYALLKKLRINQCIIFCNSVNRVELLSQKLTRLGFACHYIHGQMGQKHRNRVFHNFRENKKVRYLVCTDIFTRGIDVKDVNVVLNFDFPRSANTYLHRIGRSGRFGQKGLSVNFITNNDRYNLCKIETELNTEIEPIPPTIDETEYCGP